MDVFGVLCSAVRVCVCWIAASLCARVCDSESKEMVNPVHSACMPSL